MRTICRNWKNGERRERKRDRETHKEKERERDRYKKSTVESKYCNHSIYILVSTRSVEEKVVYADSSGEARKKAAERGRKEGRKTTKEARVRVRVGREKKI